MSERFSLLLPVYHRDDPEYLREAYESSTSGQTRPPAEVVLVEDGPLPPRLQQVVRTLEGDTPVVRIALPENQGLARALTAGLAACTHEIVARMDADDISLPERFEKQLPHIEQGAGICGTGLYEMGRDREDILRERIPPTGEAIHTAARWRSPFNHPTVVYRKTEVRRAGGYRDLPLLEDYWLFTRMLGAGVEAVNIPEPLVLYRVGAGAYSRRGGGRLLLSELQLQRHLHREGFTTRKEMLRNIGVRGGYRLVPEWVRRPTYRRYLTSTTGSVEGT